MYRWTEAFPGRLEAELEAFASDPRLNFKLDQSELADKGKVVLRGTLEYRGESIQLIVSYPDVFPYVRPEVFAPELQLTRHQNPYEGNLCLLDRATRAWNPSDTAAWLVGERVSDLLDALEQGPAAVAAIEVAQGEPVSTYFGGAPGAVVFVPDEFLKLPGSVRTGVAQLAINEAEAAQLVRACLVGVAQRGRRGKITKLAELSDGRLRKRFPEMKFRASWARLDELPRGAASPDQILASARAVEGFEEAPWQRIPDGQTRITGVVFKEEIRQGEFEDDWLFAVEIALDDGTKGSYFANTERLSPADLQERIPKLAGLAEKAVAVAGLGAIGAPIALELARAQIGRLTVLDGDSVQAGTIVRWPRGLHSVGHLKTAVIEGVIHSDYPFTDVVTIAHRLGRVPPPGLEPPLRDREVAEQLLGGVDLLVDATAEIGIQQLLAALAQDRGLPQVFVWMTEGGQGGAVARIVPGETGCWFCLQLRLNDGSIPVPPREEAGTIQPRGCASPTFTGSSIDGLAISVHAARTVTQTLLHGRRGDEHDVFICNQASSERDRLLAPTWASYVLEKHPDCDCSGADKRP